MSCKSFQKEIVIPRETIQTALDKKFPVDKNLIITRLTLKEPHVYFKNTNIGITLLYNGNFLEKEIEGNVDLNGHIRYKGGALFIDSLEIVELTVNEKEFSSNDKFRKGIINLVKNYLERYPVYTLKQSDFKQNVARLLLKDITTDEDNLKVTLGL